MVHTVGMELLEAVPGCGVLPDLLHELGRLGYELPAALHVVHLERSELHSRYEFQNRAPCRFEYTERSRVRSHPEVNLPLQELSGNPIPICP